MKTAMKRTVFTVKLRKMDYKEEWSLYIEAFPVFVANKKTPVRQHETLNRYITTPIWDKNSVSKTRNDKKYYRPKRDNNGIIQCRSQQDQQSCIFAKLRVAVVVGDVPDLASHVRSSTFFARWSTDRK